MASTIKKKTKKSAKSLSTNGEMSPRLESLLNLINKDQWTEEEKSIAEQAVKDAEKELASTNREIEIEAALEKVRAKALSMNDPSDMPEVCHAISDQLENLNVKNIRNVQTAVINQSKGTYFNYEYYAKHRRTFITEVDYSHHPMSLGFINQMLRGPGEFFSHTLEGKELKDWYAYQKTTNQFADQYLESAESLSYYWYSLGPVALGISTYSPLNDEEMDLFKRFRNVFELAYRRFLDIETAISQTREAQIEAALERVRSSALAMLKSKDMNDAVAVMFEALEKLEPGMLRCGVGILKRESRTADVWATFAGEHGRVVKVTGDESVDIHPLLHGAYDAWLNQHDFLYELKGEDLIKYYTALTKTNFQLPEAQSIIEKAEAQQSSKPLQQYYYVAPFEDGNLFAFRETPFPDEAKRVMRRFASAFNLTYKRFIDLQKAEAQARESKIQLALERVRARAMAMQKSDEVSEVASVLFRQFKELGELPIMITIGIFNEAKGLIEFRITSWSGSGEQLNTSFTADIHEPTLLNKIFEAWKDQMKSVIIPLEGKDLIEWVKYRSIISGEKDEKDYSHTHRYVNAAFFSKGYLSVSTVEPPADETVKIIERFARVFDLAYTRFLDLQKAEAQAREARIEAALERVRAEAMAMHTTNELKSVGEIIFAELNSLGFTDIRNTEIIINNDEKETILSHYCDYGIPGTIEVNYKTNPILHNWANELKKASDAFVSVVISEKEMTEWRKFREEIGYQPDPKLNAAKSVYYYSYSTGLGALSISSFSPIGEDQMKTLQRFRNVFALAYRRYVDVAQAEERAREARIELALERVRASAMSMKQATEMAEVCRIISEQLQQLGIEAIRNVQTAIINEEKGTYTKYEYFTQYNITSVVEIEIKLHPVIEEFVNKILSNKDSFFTKTVEGKDLEILHSYRKSTHQNPDPILEKVNAVHYYFYSIGPGALGICTFSPLGDTEINLFKRFKNVFELAYRRFLDIQQAEEQARETQIQLALERVRARTMAMQKSDELSETVYTLFKQFRELGENPDMATIGIVNEEEKVIEYWVTMYGNQTNRVFKFSMDEPNVTNKIYNGWKEGRKSLVIDLSGKELHEFMKYRESMGGAKYNPQEKRRIINVAFFTKGLLNVQSNEARSEESIRLLERFASVFEQTYTRFLDLQKAEAQAREAKIEAALERVRSKTMAMHSSKDVADTVATMFDELKKLGIETFRCGIGIMQEKEQMEVWTAKPSEAGKADLIIGRLDMSKHALLRGAYSGWKNKKETFSYELDGDNLKDYFTMINNHPDYPVKYEFESLPSKIFHHDFYFIEGTLFVFSLQPLTEETIKIFKRFSAVFGQTYKRFLDLQKAEAQARESQIELALERVRARTMAMQKSDELKEVIRVVYEQFVHLKVNVDHAGFVVDYTPKGDWHFWIADKQEIPSKITHPYFDSVWANQFDEAKEKGIDFFVTNLNFEEKNKFYRDLLSYVPGLSEQSKEFYFNCPGLAASNVLMEDVALYIENFSAIPYTDEENKILMRFGKVFQQTYTRFLDLRKAEEQAREAQIELALERVRARTSAMQHSEELLEVINVIAVQLRDLNIKFHFVSFGVNSRDSDFDFWLASPAFSRPEHIHMPSLDNPITNTVIEAQKKGLNFFANIFSQTENREWLEVLFKNNKTTQISEEEKDYLLNAPGFARSAVLSKNISIFLGNYVPKAYSGEQNDILVRFANVFEQSYTRFLDLRKAEAQARESQIEASLERVRGRAMAMRNSSDLSEAAGTVFTELNKLGINPIRSGFVLLTKDSRRAKLYPATSFNKSDTLSFNGEFEFVGHPIFEKQYESWQNGENYFPVLEGDVMKSYYEILSRELSVPIDYFPTNQKQFGSFFPFTGGFLFTWSAEPYSEKEASILERFKSILDLTIRRYTDLKTTEAQAREAQIEAGLERVRSRTLAMHSSDELAETAAVLFKQLINLGIEPNRLYISIIKDETGNSEFWITDEDGSKVSSAYTANLNDNPSFLKMFNGWKEHKKSITIDMNGKELEEYFQHLQRLNVPFKGGLTQTRRVQSVAYFSQGFIGIASPDSQPAETNLLLERFASVFNLTYTRFSDLQLAEAQAKHAQMEAAMERVRGRALAMQQPEELMDVAETLRKEMGALGVAEIETGTIFIFDEETETAQFGFTARDFSQPGKPAVTDTITIDLNHTWAGKEILKFFRSAENKMTLRMEGQQRKEWIDDIYAHSSAANNYFGENIRDRTYHLLKFSNGAVAAVTDGLTLSDESWELLSRASSVFSLAYSRFKDLTKARIDLQNLKEEKKRSESLLLNILPEEIAAELKQFGKSYARKYDQVTILFADIKGFSSIAETLSAQELVTQLDECFRAFDHIVDKHGLEKIKTVGDAYVCACGLPKPVPDNAARAVRAAIDMMSFIKGFSITRTIQDLPAFEFRIGIHTGPVVTGVVGLKKFTYDIWGDAVNMAARMEQHGEAGRINISESTYELIKDKFNCTARGKIAAKNKGEVEMYFVE